MSNREDRLWEQKRQEVLALGHGDGCWNCGDVSGPIHIHHRYYEAGKEKWNYPAESFDALCATCHAKADDQRRKLCRAHGLLDSATAEMALGYMWAIRAIWEYCESTLTTSDFHSAEFLMGVASAYGITEREVWQGIEKRKGILDPADLALVSPLPCFRNLKAEQA
jgi:hypothetical protein